MNEANSDDSDVYMYQTCDQALRDKRTTDAFCSRKSSSRCSSSFFWTLSHFRWSLQLIPCFSNYATRTL